MAAEPMNEGANEERPPSPPVLQSPGHAAGDSPPHASDGKFSHLGIIVLRIYTFLSFLLMLLHYSQLNLCPILVRRS